MANFKHFEISARDGRISIRDTNNKLSQWKVSVTSFLYSGPVHISETRNLLKDGADTSKVELTKPIIRVTTNKAQSFDITRGDLLDIMSDVKAGKKRIAIDRTLATIVLNRV